MELTNSTIQHLDDNVVEDIIYAQEPFSYETFRIIHVCLVTVGTGSVGLFGVVSNTINIIVFWRQGFLTSSATVNLTTLAFSDLISSIMSFWFAVCTIIYMYTESQTVRLDQLWDYTSSRPLFCTGQMTCFITVVLAFERVISVTFPFKVKTIFSPKRSLVAMITIIIGNVIINIPNLFEEVPVWEMHPERNATVLTWVASKPLQLRMVQLVYFYSSVAIRFLTVFIVVVCNVILFWKVNFSQKFRKRSEVGSDALKKDEKDNKDNVKKSATEDKPNSNKEMKLLRMITVISVVFAFCYSLTIIGDITYYLARENAIDYHEYERFVAWAVQVFFQTINSSSNIFIFYKMSSRFREDLLQLWKKIL